MTKPIKNILKAYLLLGLVVVFAACSDNASNPKWTLNLLSVHPIEGKLITDVWSYANGSKEYAIVGDFTRLVDSNSLGSVTIVDVTDPNDPKTVSVIESVLGFDVKVWGDYLYISNGGYGLPFANEADSSLIFNISSPDSPVRAGTFPISHNVFIDNNGYMYLQGEKKDEGLSIYDLNTTPDKPALVWKDTELESGHDVTVIGNRLYDYHGELGTFIYDISDPTSPVLLSTIIEMDIFHHSGWASEDNSILVISDETNFSDKDGFDLSIWDVGLTTNENKLLGTISNGSSLSHNAYLKNNILYVSFYNAGLQIYDIADPANPTLIAGYDTNASGGTGLNAFSLGAFGIHVNERTNNIYVTDMDNGLFVFSLEK